MEPGGSPASTGARAVAGNGLWLFSGQLVAKLASLVFVVIVARAVGVREYGWFVFATSFVPLALSLASFGLDSAVVREVARDRDRLSQVFASGLALRLGAGSVALLLALALTPLFLRERLALVTVAVVGTALLLDEVTTYLSNVFKAFERMRFHATALMVNRIGSTLLALAAYLADAGLVTILVTYLLGSLGALVYCAVILRRRFPPIGLREGSRGTAGRLLRIGAPLGVASVLNMALFRADALMVQAYDGAEAVGLYGVAFRFFESFLFVSWVLGSLTLPRYARQSRGPESARTFDVALTTALSFYLPLAVLSLFASEWAVTTLFGARYADAAVAVPWLTGALVLYAVTYQARTASVGVGARGVIAWIAAIALVINIAANLVLIPRLGFEGAAIATALAAAVEAVLSVAAVRRQGVPVRVSRLLAVPVLAAAVTGAVVAALALEDGAAAAIGSGLYVVVLVLLGALIAPDAKGAVAGLVRRRAAR